MRPFAILAALDDYAAVRELVFDLVAEGVEATVPDTIRETVAAVVSVLANQVAESLDGSADGATVVSVAREVRIDKSAASRRVKAAIRRGLLKNLETRRGHPSRLVPGDPLPDELELLPPPERLADSGCTVVTVSEGIHQPPSPLASAVAR